MDLNNSSFVNITMDSTDSILASPTDKGANSAAKNIAQAGQGAVDRGIEQVSKVATSEVEMAADKAKAYVLDDNTGSKSLTDLNDNQFIENVKSSLYEELDEKKEKVEVEIKSAVDAPDLDALADKLDVPAAALGVDGNLSEKLGELKSSIVAEAENTEAPTVSSDADVNKIDTSADISVGNSVKFTNEEKNGDVFEVVKDAAVTAVSDVQGGMSVEVAGKKAVSTVVTNVGPNVSAGLSRLSGGGSPLPTESTESRDNPFIPDGELSKETDELLKRATIIRDKFYLDQQEKERKALADKDTTDNVVAEKSPVQESVVAPVAAQPAQSQAKGSQPATAEVKPRMRENGKVEDTVSPEGVKPEVEKGAVAPNADVSKTAPEASGENDKEKKKQKKCCSVM